MADQQSPVFPVLQSAFPPLVLRRENKLLLGAGLILFMLAWVGAAVSLAVFIGEVVTLGVCLGVLMVPALIGLVLLYLGFNQKQTMADPKAVLSEHMQAQKDWQAMKVEGDLDWIDAGERVAQYWQAQQVQARLSSHKIRRRLRIWGLVLIAVSVEFLVIAVLILRETSFEARMMFIPLTALPALVGLMLMSRAWGIKRREEKNLETLQAYAAALGEVSQLK